MFRPGTSRRRHAHQKPHHGPVGCREQQRQHHERQQHQRPDLGPPVGQPGVPVLL
jgi:hypothetical protein